MSTDITINVTADNIKAKSNGKYKGDFTFVQTAGSPTITDSKGNLDLSDVSGKADIDFQWDSPTVEIDGQSYPASYFYGPQTSNNILVSEGEGSDPEKKGSNPPIGGDDQFTVQESDSPGHFTLVDQNSDKKKYQYCMVVYVDINGGAQLVNDPKIVNRPN